MTAEPLPLWPGLNEEGRYSVWSQLVDGFEEYISYPAFCDLMDSRSK